MARISTYTKDTIPNDNDLLVGSEYISTINGVDSFNTKTYKLRDLATYFANFTSQAGDSFNLASISQSVTTNTTNISSNAQYSLNLAASFGTFDANGNLVSLSQAFANNVLNVSASTNYATATQLGTLTATVNNNTASISTNATEITSVTASTTTNTNNISTNTGNITSVTNTATSNASNISTLTNNLATANTSINQNASDVTSLTGTVNTNTTTITGKPETFRQTNAPGVSKPVGSLWFDSNDGNKAYILVSGSPNVWTEIPDSRIAANATSITTNTTNITANASDITTLTNSIATTNANVTQNATNTTNLTSTVTSNTTAITSNDGDITTANTNIAANASDITTLTNNLATANTNINQNASDVTSLTSTVNSNTSSLGTNTTSISTNASNITTLNNNLSTTNTNVSQNATDLTSLTTTVNGNTGNISANASSISSLTTTVNGNTADITSVSTIANRSDGFIKSSYGLTATAGGVITGMQIVAGNNTTSSISEVKFQADKFIVNSSSTNLTPFSISGNKIKFNGDLSVTGTALIQGTDTTADEFLALTVLNSGSTSKVGMKLQNNDGYFGKIFLDTSSENNINNYSLDFFIGPTEQRLARMSGGGLSLDTGRIYFNDSFTGNTTGNGRGSISVEGVASGTGKTMYVVTPSNQSSSYAFALRDNSSVDYFKAYTSGLLEVAKVSITGSHLFENITGDHLGLTSNTGKNISFRTGTSQRMIIESGGEVGINQGSPSATLHLTALSSNGVPFKLEGHASTTVEQMNIFTTKAAGTDWYNIVAQANSVNQLIIYGNGNIQNANNSYGQISDSALKENIVAATDKLEEVKQLQVKNFNFIGDTQKQIGLIAQDVETIFPGLVESIKQPDIEGGAEGGTYKSIKYSVLVPILIKAIQELEARVAALETP